MSIKAQNDISTFQFKYNKMISEWIDNKTHNDDGSQFLSVGPDSDKINREKTEKMFSRTIQTMMDEYQYEEIQNHEDEKEHNDFRYRTFIINEDLYSLAFASLINPDQLQYTEDEMNDKDMLPLNLNLTRRERGGIYQSAIMVIFIQIATIYLLIEYFSEQTGLNN